MRSILYFIHLMMILCLLLSLWISPHHHEVLIYCMIFVPHLTLYLRSNEHQFSNCLILWLDHGTIYCIIKLPYHFVHVVICGHFPKFTFFHFFQNIIFALSLFWFILATYWQSPGMVLVYIHDIWSNSSVCYGNS